MTFLHLQSTVTMEGWLLCNLHSHSRGVLWFKSLSFKSQVLTVSLGKNILGRLSKVNVGGRYSHYLKEERGKMSDSFWKTRYSCCSSLHQLYNHGSKQHKERERQSSRGIEWRIRCDVPGERDQQWCWQRRAGATGGHWWIGKVQICCKLLAYMSHTQEHLHTHSPLNLHS